MANLASNPWSFSSGDQSNTTITSITETGNTVTVGATAHGYNVGQSISIGGVSPLSYNGLWVVSSVVNANSFKYINPVSGLANGAVISGSLPWYPNMVTGVPAWKPKARIEQLVWQGAPSSDTLYLYDASGDLIWYQVAGSVDATYTYGKLYWIDGLWIANLPGGAVLVTIN